MRHIDKFFKTFEQAVKVQDEANEKRKATQLERCQKLIPQHDYVQVNGNIYRCTGCKKTLSVEQVNF